MESLLIVEDNDSMRQMLAKTFQTGGYQVESAKNGSSALQIISTRKFDIVVTDLKLTDMDGVEILSAVKDLDTQTQVIVMTAYGSV